MTEADVRLSLALEAGLGCPPLIRCDGKVAQDKRWQFEPWEQPDEWRSKLLAHDGNLGLVTGCGPDRERGLLVLDLDNYKPEGAETLEAIAGLGWFDVDTLTDETPRGGTHRFYTYDPGEWIVRCRDLGKYDLPGGAEVKAEGGYVVVYGTWTDDVEPTLANVAPAPEGLLELVGQRIGEATPGVVEQWRRWDPNVVDPATAEAVAILLEHFGGHSPLILTNGREPHVELVRPGKDAADGRSATVGWIKPGVTKVFSCEWPGFDQGEVIDLGQLRERAGLGQVITFRNRIELPTGYRAWTPEDGDTPPPTLGEAIYQGPLGDYLRRLNGETEAHPAAIGAHLLAAVSTMAGTRAIYAAGSIRHQTNIFIAVVGLSSTGAKGVAQGEANRLVRAIDPTFLGAHTLAGLGSGEQLVYEVRDPNPADPEDLGGRKERVIQNAELSQVFRVAGRDGSTLSDQLRLAYDGEPLRHSTRAHGIVTSTGHHISIVGSITPSELVALMDDTSKTNGFGNRFLYVHSEMQGFLPFGGQVPNDVVTGLAHRIGVRLTELGERAGHLNVAVYRLADDARDTWEAFYRFARTGIGQGVAREMTGRSVAHAVRIATLYAILDGADAIHTRHLDAARAWIEYGAATVAQVFATSSVGNAGQLLAAIRDAGPDGLTLTEQSAVFHRNRTAEELATMREELAQRRLIATVRTNSSGGRPPDRSIAIWPDPTTNERTNEGTGEA